MTATPRKAVATPVLFKRMTSVASQHLDSTTSHRMQDSEGNAYDWPSWPPWAVASLATIMTIGYLLGVLLYSSNFPAVARPVDRLICSIWRNNSFPDQKRRSCRQDTDDNEMAARSDQYCNFDTATLSHHPPVGLGISTGIEDVELATFVPRRHTTRESHSIRRSFDEEALRPWPQKARDGFWGSFTAPISQATQFNHAFLGGSEKPGERPQECAFDSTDESTRSAHSSDSLLPDHESHGRPNTGPVETLLNNVAETIERVASWVAERSHQPVGEQRPGRDVVAHQTIRSGV